ncbi:MAG: ATP-binding protein [Limnohabitans sp.]
MQFMKATRKKSKLRLALTGPSGSGKTYGALKIAKGLGGKIAVIDSEHGSASLYANLCDYDTLELGPPYSPERYIEAIKTAESAGYDVIVIDSTTHEWSGTGGCLEINEQIAKSKFQGNTWSAWNVTTPRHRAFIDAMLQSSAHIIATGRSKTETAQTEGPNGKKKVVKLGMKTEQRDGFEYEFTVVLDLIHDGHFANASKDRTGLFSGDAKAITEDTGKALRAWLESGVDAPAEPPASAPTPAGFDAKARVREVKTGIAAKDASGAATYLSGLPQDELEAIWALLSPADQDALTAAWPQGAAA